MKKTLASLLLFTIGLVSTSIFAFAYQLGIDHNNQWGVGRVLGFSVGILVIISAFITFFFGTQIVFFAKNNLTRNNLFRSFAYFERHRMKLIYLSIVLVSIFITVSYVWFISIGTWTNWPKTSDYRGGYFDQLGTAFDRGQLYIEAKPDPMLLSLPDPYDPIARKKLPNNDELKKDIFDLSLYNGKFYLYWGPMPAILIAIIKPFISVKISDPVLVFAFTLILFIIQSLLLIRIWSRLFNHLPVWTLLTIILTGGLINPIPFMLGQPRTYEAAIICGQLFLVGGIYFAYTALDKSCSSKYRLALSGISWACAIGSRAFLLFPIIFLVFMILVFLTKKHFNKNSNREFFSLIAALFLPLIVGGAGLAWYNWARFGSIFEFGLKYQITMVNFNKPSNNSFSLAFIPVNIYVYLFNIPEFTHSFPFIKPGLVEGGYFLYSHLPANYTAEHILGPFYAIPFIIFSIIPIISVIPRISLKRRSNASTEIYNWLQQSLLGSLILSAIPLLLFFYSAQRYLEDITPSLFLIAAFGFWQGYNLLDKNHFMRILYSLTASILIFTSAAIGFLLYFSSDPLRIKSTNSALLTHLVLFFMKIMKVHGH